MSDHLTTRQCNECKLAERARALDRDREYLRKRAKLGAFGMTWDEIEKKQGGKLRRNK